MKLTDESLTYCYYAGRLHYADALRRITLCELHWLSATYIYREESFS